MTNSERVQGASSEELAKIITHELQGMCNSCKFYYTPECRFDDEGEIVNHGACEKGIEMWLNEESE